MSRGNGVEAREKSIRLFFVLDGVHRRETLRVNGEPVPPTPANLKFANRLAAEIRAKISAGVFVLHEYFPTSADATVGQGLTVSSQLDAWLLTQRIKASTRAGYDSAAMFWRRTIGDKLMRSVKHSDILAALATKPGLSGKTINNYVSVLREALQLAVLDKIISVNPAADIPRATWQKPVVDPFSQAEVESIVLDMAANYDAQVCNLVEAWMFTGMRTSEIFALRWDNVDLSAGTALVTEALVRGVEEDSTKTGVARTVRLNSRALAAIKRQAEEHTSGTHGRRVFEDPRYGLGWVDERAFRRSFWEPTLRRAGIRYRRPYTMRHTYASLMLMAGMRPAFCARQLGHSVDVFHTTYAKWIDGDADAGEMSLLEARISGTSPALP